MGAVADAALEAGGQVIGFIPQARVAKEVAHDRLSDLRVVPSMHARKAAMAQLADAFIAPGVRVIGVQAHGAPSYYLSWREGRVVATDTCRTIADGLATRTPRREEREGDPRGGRRHAAGRRRGILAASKLVATDEHVVAEPAAAATVSPLLAGSHRSDLHAAGAGNRPIVLIISGGSIDPGILRRIGEA